MSSCYIQTKCILFNRTAIGNLVSLLACQWVSQHKHLLPLCPQVQKEINFVRVKDLKNVNEQKRLLRMTKFCCVPDTVLQRISNVLRFCWVLLSALLDSLTAWVRGLCQEHIDISTVLRIERCMLMQQAKQVGQQQCRKSRKHIRERAMSFFCLQGKVPTREAIHVYYQEQMLKSSKESGLDFYSHDDEVYVSGGMGQNEEKEGAGTDENEEETAGQKPETNLGEYSSPALEPVLDPATGVDGLEERTLRAFSPGDWEHTEEHNGGDYPESSVATTSHKCRPKLSRMDRVESSSISSSSDKERVMCSYR